MLQSKVAAEFLFLNINSMDKINRNNITHQDPRQRSKATSGFYNMFTSLRIYIELQ